jgi:outer membrane protein, multidrug efflux system
VRVNQARDNSRFLSEQRIGDPIQALSYQRALIEATHQLEDQRRALSLAKTELAILINLPIGSTVNLATSDDYPEPQLKVDLGVLEQEVLATRPELRDQDYQARISTSETRKAWLPRSSNLRTAA